MNLNPPTFYELREDYRHDVTPEQRGDWHWPMRNRVKNAGQLREIVHLTPDEEEAVRRKPDLKVGITPHFAALMDPNDPHCPTIGFKPFRQWPSSRLTPPT